MNHSKVNKAKMRAVQVVRLSLEEQIAIRVKEGAGEGVR
jgi:hypothetical protein